MPRKYVMTEKERRATKFTLATRIVIFAIPAFSVSYIFIKCPYDHVLSYQYQNKATWISFSSQTGLFAGKRLNE